MISKISALIADIDGTLVGKGQPLLPGTRAALERLHKEGALIGTASGRPLDRRTFAHARQWGLSFDFDMAFGMNGGDYWDKNCDEIEHLYLLKKEYMKEILSFMTELDVNCMVYEDAYDHILTLRDDEHMRRSQQRNHSFTEVVSAERMCQSDTGKLEFHYTEDLEEAVMQKIAQHPSQNWVAVQTFKGTVEFMDPRVNKGMALERFAKLNNIPIDEIISFGDMENDIELLKAAGWGVCLENGSDAAKSAADDITEYPVEENGIGRYLAENYWKTDYEKIF